MTIRAESGAPHDALATGDDTIREGAIRWLMWLRVAGDAAEEFAACERWCRCSAAHAAAMHEVLWLWAAMRMLDRRLPH